MPEFVRQIDAGGPVSITDPEVERYFMTISEAVSLVVRAGAEAEGGELFMLDMGRPIKIADLVKRIIRLRGLRVGKDIEIVYTGLRPGEKLTEDLVFSAERMTPTSNASIFRVDDSGVPNLFELEQSVSVLAEAANVEEAGALHVLLAKAARGERLGRKSRLTSTG